MGDAKHLPVPRDLPHLFADGVGGLAACLCGALVFTNKPDPTTNSFWRIRAVP
jgi:hypothetical protein